MAIVLFITFLLRFVFYDSLGIYKLICLPRLFVLKTVMSDCQLCTRRGSKL